MMDTLARKENDFSTVNNFQQESKYDKLILQAIFNTAFTLGTWFGASKERQQYIAETSSTVSYITAEVRALEKNFEHLSNKIDNRFDKLDGKFEDFRKEVKYDHKGLSDALGDINTKLTKIETITEATQKRTEAWKIYLLFPIITATFVYFMGKILP